MSYLSFPLGAFNTFSLSLIFVSLITVCLGVFLLDFILPGTRCFLDLVDYFLPTHSSVLAWRIPGMAEPGGLLSMGSHRVRHD